MLAKAYRSSKYFEKSSGLMLSMKSLNFLVSSSSFSAFTILAFAMTDSET